MPFGKSPAGSGLQILFKPRSCLFRRKYAMPLQMKEATFCHRSKSLLVFYHSTIKIMGKPRIVEILCFIFQKVHVVHILSRRSDSKIYLFMVSSCLVFSSSRLHTEAPSYGAKVWRRERDSNPRAGKTPT